MSWGQAANLKEDISYSLFPPTLPGAVVKNLYYENWRFPTSLDDCIYFVRNFNALKQPISHDYPVILPIVFVVSYLLFVYFGQKFMKNREAFQLTFLLRVWNLFLFVFSLIMFLGLLQPIYFLWQTKGYYEVVCLPDQDLLFGAPFFMIWVFALSKYIELIDTVFLVLRKKHVDFLHWYHHTTVLLYTWYGLVILLSPGSIYGLINTFVHTFMYYYFFLTSCGYRPGWGKFVTIIQIVQMVLGLATGISWSYYYLAGYRCPAYSNVSIFFTATIAIYGSYFLLFFNFYRKRYNSRRPVIQSPTNSPTSTPTSTKKVVKKD